MEGGVTKRQVLANVAGIVLVLGGLYLLFDHFGITRVQETIAAGGVWASFALVLAKISTLVIAPLGGAPLYPLAGALFGFWKGTALILLGDAIGCTAAFYISRIFGRSVVEKLIGNDKQFLSRALKMMGTTRGFLVARICFLPLPEVAAYGAGLTRINFAPFITICVAVSIVPVAILVGIGSVLTLETWWMLPIALAAGAVTIPIGFLLFRSLLAEWEKMKEGE